MASSGVWDLAGPSQPGSRVQAAGVSRGAPLGAASSLPTMVPAREALPALLAPPRHGAPRHPGQLGREAGSDPLLSATLLPLRLPGAGQAGGTSLEVLAVWCVSHMSAFPFLSFTESSCEGRE